MNETLKAIVIELTAGNVRNHQIDLHGALGFFPNDCLGGSNEHAPASSITVRIGKDSVKTSIDKDAAIFTERGAIRRFFEGETISEGDLTVIERLQPREFQLWKASKRGFRYYL